MKCWALAIFVAVALSVVGCGDDPFEHRSTRDEAEQTEHSMLKGVGRKIDGD